MSVTPGLLERLLQWATWADKSQNEALAQTLRDAAYHLSPKLRRREVSCVTCHAMYLPSRRPNENRRTYCPSCRADGAAHRDAQRQYQAKRYRAAVMREVERLERAPATTEDPSVARMRL